MTTQALALATLVGALIVVAAVLVYRDRHDARLTRYLEDQGERRLVGELVQVNTPRPDDQTIRGVCTAELRGGGLVLTAAEYLERELARGEERARRVPIDGDVVIPAYSFAQIVHRTQED